MLNIHPVIRVHFIERFFKSKHKFVKVMPTDYKKALIMLENEKVKEKIK